MLEFLGAIFLFIIIVASSFITTLFIVVILKEEKKIDLLHLFKIGYCITNKEMSVINRIDQRGQERGEIIENVRDFFKNNFINLSEEEMTDLYNVSNGEKSNLQFIVNKANSETEATITEEAIEEASITIAEELERFAD